VAALFLLVTVYCCICNINSIEIDDIETEG